MFSMGRKDKSIHKFAGWKVCKTVGGFSECFLNLQTQNEVFNECVNQIICSLNYRNIWCCTSKRFFKTSRPTYPKIYFKLISPKIIFYSSLYYLKRFQEYFKGICETYETIWCQSEIWKTYPLAFFVVNRGSDMNSLSFACKNNEWRHSVRCFGSLALISF